MATRVPPLYFSAPVIYLLLIAGLLYVQFSGTARVREKAGAITVSATTARADRNGRPRDLEINAGDLVLRFDGQRQARFENKDGLFRDAELLQYSIVTESVVLEFAEGVVIELEDAGNSEILLSIVEDRMDPGTAFRLPVNIALEPAVSASSKLPVFTAGVTLIALPTSVSYTLGELRFASEGRSTEQVLIVTDLTDVAPHELWLRRMYNFPARERFASRLDEFLDAAYRGFLVTRLDRTRSVWLREGQPSSFDDRIFSLLIHSLGHHIGNINAIKVS